MLSLIVRGFTCRLKAAIRPHLNVARGAVEREIVIVREAVKFPRREVVVGMPRWRTPASRAALSRGGHDRTTYDDGANDSHVTLCSCPKQVDLVGGLYTQNSPDHVLQTGVDVIIFVIAKHAENGFKD